MWRKQKKNQYANKVKKQSLNLKKKYSGMFVVFLWSNSRDSFPVAELRQSNKCYVHKSLASRLASNTSGDTANLFFERRLSLNFWIFDKLY